MANFFFILFHHSTTTAIRVHPLSMKPHSSKNDQDKRDEKETLPLQQQEVIIHRMWKVFAPHTILGKRWRTTFKSLHYYVPCTVGCAPERFPRKTAPFPRKTPPDIWRNGKVRVKEWLSTPTIGHEVEKSNSLSLGSLHADSGYNCHEHDFYFNERQSFTLIPPKL